MMDHLIPQRRVLDDLMATLDVDVVSTSERLVSPGWRLKFPSSPLPGIHYSLKGSGRMFVGDAPPISLIPHTLVITPPGQPFRIDVAADDQPTTFKVMEAPHPSAGSSPIVETLVAGNEEPALMMLCDHFRASYGASVQLFAGLRSPIVEQFDAADHLADKLLLVAVERNAQEVGMELMVTALLKQVLVAVLRRSLGSTDAWLQRFRILSDPQIARALADMVSRPGAPHSLSTLAETAGLSRSAFMSRFTRSFQASPMAVLRQVRMRRATNLLMAKTLSIDQVARAVGYSSRSSFSRNFRLFTGADPSRALIRE
jgi:AraC-like DNA-binding protein